MNNGSGNDEERKMAVIYNDIFSYVASKLFHFISIVNCLFYVSTEGNKSTYRTGQLNFACKSGTMGMLLSHLSKKSVCCTCRLLLISCWHMCFLITAYIFVMAMKVLKNFFATTAE